MYTPESPRTDLINDFRKMYCYRPWTCQKAYWYGNIPRKGLLETGSIRECAYTLHWPGKTWLTAGSKCHDRIGLVLNTSCNNGFEHLVQQRVWTLGATTGLNTWCNNGFEHLVQHRVWTLRSNKLPGEPRALLKSCVIAMRLVLITVEPHTAVSMSRYWRTTKNGEEFLIRSLHQV